MHVQLYDSALGLIFVYVRPFCMQTAKALASMR